MTANALTVFPFLSLASRHDSIGFLYNWYSMKQFLPEAVVTKLLLDSAHDAMPYYEYCCRDGTEPAKGRTKFKCPKISFAGSNVTCTCENPCSTAKYGRTAHLVLKDNPRLFNAPPRSSREWKLEYNARTSDERCNKREKVGEKLEDGRYRSSKMWYCHLFSIMICQHLDAWNLPKTSRLKEVL